jgi:cell shape-determining protein MreC
MIAFFLSHKIYRYIVFMFIMYVVFKSTPNLNLNNKMITHITILTTIINYVMDNIAEISKEELSKTQNKKKKKKKNKKMKKKIKLKKESVNYDSVIW